ncbi:MoxR family ATPase [Phormidium yuhuli AB48]|uniref:MoxR family ATPase n=1 Tax=Phormidium yuhuli AB48 TaxID=2940671 RepID=A0ABY5AXC3_9CYAN|nr:MoxR family ATPase [Phormidium yuhuli]USR92718.1 MoxR family ATPase [Phormidium yuhuli AB48]
MSLNQYHFDGNPARRPQNPHPDSPSKLEPYVAADDLKTAVNLAIYLRRPLLLEGEAGCGKTRLAVAVAYELGLPFYRWDIRSTTKAKEGLYEYDAILRLHDVQICDKTQKLPEDGHRDPQKPGDYIELGAIGKAFNADRPAVLLIDEIDKAELDFPNDLLAVLDEPWSFEIRETGQVGDRAVRAKHKPIVIVTSNKEKGNLPAPFLRRCLYYYLKFPQERLPEIVAAHYQPQAGNSQDEGDAVAPPPEPLVDRAIDLFLQVREQGLVKPPGTSEFLDWLRALAGFQTQPFPVDQLSLETLPYRELLLKLRQDWQQEFVTAEETG